MMHMRRFRRLDYLLVGGVQPAVADILHNGAVKQPGILKHHTEHLPQLFPVEPPDIVAAYQNRAAADIVKPHQQLHHGGFSRAGRPYDSHLLSGLHMGAEIIDDGFIRQITEFDILKLHITRTVDDGNRVFDRLILFRLVQKLEHPLRSRGCRLEQVAHLGDLLNRLGKHLIILDKGLDISHRNDSLN